MRRLLIINHKHYRVATCREGLGLFNPNLEEFWPRSVTVDQTWILHKTPETKQQSKRFVSSDEPLPEKARVDLSVNKFMVTGFWYARDTIYIDSFQKELTINDSHYPNLFDHFSDVLKKKLPYLANKKVLFNETKIM